MKDFPCDQLVELTTEYLEHRLSPADEAALEAHLRLCPACVTYLDQMRATLATLGRIPPETISPETQAALGEVFRRWRAERGG